MVTGYITLLQLEDEGPQVPLSQVPRCVKSAASMIYKPLSTKQKDHVDSLIIAAVEHRQGGTVDGSTVPVDSMPQLCTSNDMTQRTVRGFRVTIEVMLITEA